MKFLLDTNAVSELGRPNPDSGLLAWHDEIGEVAESQEAVFLSVLLIGEMDRGILKLPDGPKRRLLSAQRDAILAEYGTRILPIDMAVARQWGAVTARHRALGMSIDAVDELIAATALVHGLTVVTRNVRHFEHSGCELINPWSA